MRTSLVISCVLLALTLACGYIEAAGIRRISDRYVSAAEELRILTADESWGRAGEVVTAYLDAWKRTASWLQMLINHDDIDDVTLTLERLRAAVEAREQSACFEACAELRETARHIYHRDAFTLGNVL